MICTKTLKQKNIAYNVKYSAKTVFLASLLCVLALCSCNNGRIGNFAETNREASIFPDYSGIVLPPNIAPLNFVINEKAQRYQVELTAKTSDPVIINQTSPEIQIPLKKWKKFVAQNVGKTFDINIFTYNGKWQKYKTITNTIAPDSIDNTLVYRLVYAVNFFWQKMGIYQRNIENFTETPIFENASANHGCVNCHSFSNHDPSKMMLHFRIIHPGTMIFSGDSLQKISIRSQHLMSGSVYPAYHPGGEIIAFSVNKFEETISLQKNKAIDLCDKASDLIIYNIKTKTITTSPKVSTKNRENMPAWSPDGKWLYYISAPEANRNNMESIMRPKYSLVRIAYNAQNNTWGEPDTILSASRTGLSISFPVVSPDGRYVLCTMADYGYFTIFQENSDLYLIDPETRNYKRLELNSNDVDSYHSFSANGRWICFSSKRLDKIYTRPFIAYFDSAGNTYKPFVLPQQRPKYYNTLMANYNRPEMVSGPVNLNARQVRNLVLTEPQKVAFDTAVNVDAISSATWVKK